MFLNKLSKLLLLQTLNTAYSFVYYSSKIGHMNQPHFCSFIYNLQDLDLEMFNLLMENNLYGYIQIICVFNKIHIKNSSSHFLINFFEHLLCTNTLQGCNDFYVSTILQLFWIPINLICVCVFLRGESVGYFPFNLNQYLWTVNKQDKGPPVELLTLSPESPS